MRQPPPPPLPPSAHDVVREARIQQGLLAAGVGVPRVLAVCEDPSVIGAPFYVMEEVAGTVVTTTLPASLATPLERRRLGVALLDVLAQLHAVDWRRRDVLRLGRPDGYLERQLRRFSSLWDQNAARPLPLFMAVGEALARRRPARSEATVVHGDFRLGNVLVSATAPAGVAAILDWEMATIGDPLADLGYLTATWSDADAAPHPMLLSPVTAAEGFPSRDDLVARYAELTGRDVTELAWYQALALWKSAVFCEAIYTRFLRGERDDPWAASLESGVPRLVEAAAECLELTPGRRRRRHGSPVQ